MERLHEVLEIMDNFTDRDFKVSLGSLLEAKDRSFCIENRFQFLREEIKRQIQ